MRALLPCLLVLAAPAAQAACPAANQYNFSFTTQTVATLNYASSYTYTATSTALGSQNFSIAFAINGLSSTQVNSNQMPAITTLVNDGGTTNRNLMIGGVFSARTASITSATRVIATTFTFATPIRDFRVQLNDIDFASNQYRDWMHISGTGPGGTFAPAITTPFSNNNGSGPRTDVSSTAALGPATTPFSQIVNEGIGTATSGNNANNGTLYAAFAQPVTSVTLRYGNYPLTVTETVTGQQAYGIQSVSWCAMPTLTVAKTSAPYSDPQSGTTDPKLIPGGDLIYTITVANSNASTLDGVDLPAITDALPPAVTFYNGDIDDGGPLIANYEFIPGTSGLSLAAGNIGYSNNGGTTYTYPPAAGYDTAVTALRFAPTGAFNANSSFSIRFRVRIK